MVQISSVAGGQTLTLVKAPTYGTSVQEPTVGDLLLVRWTYGTSTTGYTVNKTYPTPHLFYRINGIVSGSLQSGSITIIVDRELPNFSGMGISSTVYAGAMVYYNQVSYSGESVLNMSPTEYLDESVISFMENSQSPTVIYPFWNLSIIYTEEIAGVLQVI